MPVDVSVIVPFFNPGANIEDCIESVLDQTLARDRYEVVLVDDGSTDGSLGRVEHWVSRHPDVLTVHHIAASGGPGRPRNVAIERSSGRYVQFLDSDDTLAPRALERMLEVADSSDADVVVGKLSSDFRGIHHPMFRHTVTRRTLDDFPLMLNLTVCKMFRRDFLTTHNVRFPEGPHYIEDQHLCVESYAHARSVAVVGDLACYFYRRRRTGGRNFGDTTIVPAAYYRELAAILDVVDTQISAPQTKLAVQGRFYRNEMLGRLRGPAMLTYDEDYRRELVTRIRDLAMERFSPQLHEGLPVFLRTQSRLLLDNDLGGLVDYARRLDTLRLTATATAPTWRDGRLVVGLDASFRLEGEPLRLERDGASWLLPSWLAPTVSAADRTLHASDEADLDLATVSRADSQLWSTTDGLALEVGEDGGPRITGEVGLDPRTLMGGSALTPGMWNLRLRVIVGGLSRTSPVRPASGQTPPASAWVTVTAGVVHSVTTVWGGSAPSLSLDVDEWSHSLHDLVGEQLANPPQLDADRRLVIPAEGLHGGADDARVAWLILEPLDSVDAEAGVVTCGADLVVGPDGSAIRATIPPLPTPVSRWAVWLRIGDIGGAPPRRFTIELTQDRLGSLRVG